LLPKELILVDDASSDGGKTKDLIESLKKKILEKNIGITVLTLYLDINTGPGGARNLGWNSSTQPWIAFLDADDAWHPQKLEIACKWIKNHSDAVMLGHLTQALDKNADIPQLKTSYPIQSEQISFFQMLVANRFFTRTVMIRRDIPFRFQDKFFTEDYLLWLEVILADMPAYVLNQVLAFSFRPEFSFGGYSGQLWTHEKKELRAWNYLYLGNKISFLTLCVAIPWSYIKYLRRVFKGYMK
jgi:glycosyltransferase involved in cell wall biosynthesis